MNHNTHQFIHKQYLIMMYSQSLKSRAFPTTNCKLSLTCNYNLALSFDRKLNRRCTLLTGNGNVMGRSSIDEVACGRRRKHWVCRCCLLHPNTKGGCCKEELETSWFDVFSLVSSTRFVGRFVRLFVCTPDRIIVSRSKHNMSEVNFLSLSRDLPFPLSQHTESSPNNEADNRPDNRDSSRYLINRNDVCSGD